MEKFNPILQQPVRSYVAVGSVIMAVLGLSFASGILVNNGVNLSLFAAALTASLPPIEFYSSKKLQEFMSNIMNKA